MDMQIYVAIYVIEMVTIFNCSSVGEAVIEIISFHGEERHPHCVLLEKTREENRMSHTQQEML